MPTTIKDLAEWERPDWITPSDEGLPDWLLGLRSRHAEALAAYLGTISSVVASSGASERANRQHRGQFVGHDGLRKFFADNAANFEVFQARYDGVRDLGEDRVLAIGTIHIRGRGAGVETDVPVAGIATYRGGKLSRWEDLRERRAALKAVGLEE